MVKCALMCGTTIINTIKQYNSTIYTKYEYFSFLFFFHCLEDSICSSNMTVPSSLFLWIFWFKTLISISSKTLWFYFLCIRSDERSKMDHQRYHQQQQWCPMPIPYSNSHFLFCSPFNQTQNPRPQFELQLFPTSLPYPPCHRNLSLDREPYNRFHYNNLTVYGFTYEFDRNPDKRHRVDDVQTNNQNSIRSFDIDGELMMTPLMVSSLVFVGFEFQPMKQTKYRSNINGLIFIWAIIYNL